MSDATQFDWKAHLANAEGKREVFQALPPGVWTWTVIGAQFKVEENESKQNPGEKWTSHSVLFELVPDQMLTGETEVGNALSAQNKAAERKWHRVDLRKPTDTERLIENLQILGCYDPQLPLVSENGTSDCLSLVADKLPKCIAEAKTHRRKDGTPTTIIETISAP